MDTFTAIELARAAGYLLRPVASGRAYARVERGAKVLDIGPQASELDVFTAAFGDASILFADALAIVDRPAVC